MSKKRKVGADVWLHKHSYNKGPGLKKRQKENKERPARIAKHRKQRANHGYSWDDWINFDSFIAGIVANAMLQFAEDSVGYFPLNGEQITEITDETGFGYYDYPDDTYEMYQATCGAIYFALTEWLDWDLVAKCDELGNEAAWAEEARVMEEATEAMVLFAENLPRWWS